jgi:dephospho-CoA kinase
MIKVGITGGIGSGKTTVCRIFESLDIPVYYADDRAKWLMSNDLDLIKNITILFGSEAYNTDGSLNRAHISAIAFKNSSKLSALNHLVHPKVASDGEKWFAALQNKPYAIKEAALLIESQSYMQLDKLIVVTAPVELRIARVIERDNSNKEQVMARINAQMPENEKVALADFVIDNDGKQLLLPQIMKIHQTLKNSL